jgi:hypothetical protein
MVRIIEGRRKLINKGLGKLKLSKAQIDVISALKLGSFVWTNEGDNFKAWLGDDNGNRQKGIHVKTAEVLLNRGWIKFVDGDYRHRLFKYELVKI